MTRWLARAALVLIFAATCYFIYLPRAHTTIWPLGPRAHFLFVMLALIAWVLIALITLIALVILLRWLWERAW